MKILFVGIGDSAQCWYRCALPAMALGADWVGLAGVPPHARWVTGIVKGDSQRPNFMEYDVVILQSPRGAEWRKAIAAMREKGVRVIFEVDDYIRGITRLLAHDYKRDFGKRAVDDLELNMRLCDGIITTTDFLSRKFRKFNRNIWVCRNGLDLNRYRLTRPVREHPTIIWAGGTGHLGAMERWLPAVMDVLREREHVRFVTIGEAFADAIAKEFPGRCLSLPFLPIENYPGAMALGDIALAPAARNQFFRGKSDLRFLEAAALGLAVVADPFVYGETVEHGHTGLLAEEPEEVYEDLLWLVDQSAGRAQLGANAREYVWGSRDMSHVAADWRAVLELQLELAR